MSKFKQRILSAENFYADMDDFLGQKKVKKIFLVCGKSISGLNIGKYFEKLEGRTGIRVVRFSDFSPNPDYTSVVQGVDCFQKEKCDCVVAVGGGSAIDVAKCIKLFARMNHRTEYLEQKIIPNDIPFLAVPTTAGTGSEATSFAVIYLRGEKQSVDDESSIPEAVLFDPSALKTLPLYQKKATMMDALCHAVESWWSVRSTEESKAYSKQAIELILKNKDAYLDNEESGNAGMLRAANIAGKAINITQTTAGHAMCYKLTGMYGLAHGHAAALCVKQLYPYMLEHTAQCADSRGETYLKSVFQEIAEAFGCADGKEAAEKFDRLVRELALEVPSPSNEEFESLKKSVNRQRLKNNPVQLDEEAIDELYHKLTFIS